MGLKFLMAINLFMTYTTPMLAAHEELKVRALLEGQH